MKPATENIPYSRRRFLQQSLAFAGAGIGANHIVRPLFAQSAKNSEAQAKSSSPKPLMGIIEWYCYYINFDKKPVPGKVVEKCVKAHKAAGINQLVWALGRGVVDFHSSNSRNTLIGKLGSTVGGDDWSSVIRLMHKECLVRKAIKVSHQHGLKFLGRLCMNRHYGGKRSIGVTSCFSQKNPQFKERTRSGKIDSTRLCYALDEVQTERLDIITESQQLGLDGMVLDYCRQPPITRYHPKWIELYKKSGGKDPRKWKKPTKEQWLHWYQFRAGIMTQFMREVRKRVQQGEKTTGRKCQIIARISATDIIANLAAGIDIAAWLKEDLIDGVMLSPLVFCPQAKEMKFKTHVDLAHKYKKTCIGGLGSLDLIRNHVPNNTGFFQPEPMYRLLDQQYQAGVDAMSIYQTESLLQMDYLKEHLPLLGKPQTVKDRAAKSTKQKVSPWLGYDWHTSRENRFKGYTLYGTDSNSL